MAIAYPIVEGVTFKLVEGYPDYCVGDDAIFVRRRKREGLSLGDCEAIEMENNEGPVSFIAVFEREPIE